MDLRPYSCASQRSHRKWDREFESGFLQRRVGCEPACEIAAKLGIKKTALIRVRAGVGRACSSRSDFREDFAHCSQFAQ
jgi:hypothetical protein